jgi:hypothetical protein
LEESISAESVRITASETSESAILDELNTMKNWGRVHLLLFVIALNQSIFSAQEIDVEGSSDYPLLPRMEHFYISGYEQYGLESHEFYDAKDNEYVIEGRKWVIDYTLRTGFEAPGQLKVRRTHIETIKRIGGTVLFDRGLYMKVTSGNKTTWIEVWVSDHGTDYTLTIVEEAAAGRRVVSDPGLLTNDTQQTVLRSPAGKLIQDQEGKQHPDIKRIEQALTATRENRDKALAMLSDVSQKVRSGLAMACPGVARTASSPSPIPIPYPNTGRASETAKGSKKVKLAADRAVALENRAHFKKSEGDEVGRKTRTLVELIRSHYRNGTIREKERISWRDQLTSCQDQAAGIARALEKYVEEIERLLIESKKELGLK